MSTQGRESMGLIDGADAPRAGHRKPLPRAGVQVLEPTAATVAVPRQEIGQQRCNSKCLFASRDATVASSGTVRPSRESTRSSRPCPTADVRSIKGASWADPRGAR
jgi:hypothetical protein